MPGITRTAIIKISKEKNISLLEIKISLNDLFNAQEVFLTSASSFATPITQIDNKLINDGKVGKICKILRSEYLKTSTSF